MVKKEVIKKVGFRKVSSRTTDLSSCPFCNMGQYKRNIIWGIVRDMSRKDLTDLSKKRRSEK